MPFKIISPTGVYITKTLDEDEVSTLKAGKYFQLVSLMPRVFVGGSTCTSCES